MEHRVVSGGGYASVWQETERVPLVLTPLPGGGSLAEGDWAVERLAAIDGTYEIRVVAECTEEFSTSPFDTSTTGAIRGDVDVTPPTLLAFTSSSLGDTFGAGDHFTLLFSEPVVCSGHLADGVTTPTFRAQINYEGGSLTTDAGQLTHACQGNEVKLAAPGLAANLLAASVEVVVHPGLYDVAGNPFAAADVKQPLQNSSAAVERGEVRSKLAGLGSQSASINAKISSASNRTQDLVLNLKSDVGDLKSDVGDLKSDVGALNESLSHTMKQSNAEMKGVIASLTAMVASLLQASGVVETVQFPTCAGAALYSFNRYIRGSVPLDDATLAAAATAAGCAGKCLEVPSCAAFSFGDGHGCRLANKGMGVGDYDVGGRSQLYVRLAECSE